MRSKECSATRIGGFVVYGQRCGYNWPRPSIPPLLVPEYAGLVQCVSFLAGVSVAFGLALLTGLSGWSFREIFSLRSSLGKVYDCWASSRVRAGHCSGFFLSL